MKLRCWIGNYDGRQRGLVIAKSKAAARRAIGGRCSTKDFEDYWHEDERGMALGLEPDVVYLQPMDARGDTVVWTRRDP